MPPLSVTYLVLPSMIQLRLALRILGPQAQFFAIPPCSTGKVFSRHRPWGLREDLPNLRSPATQFNQMPPVAVTYRVLPSMIQLLLALRLAGPRTQFFAMPTCSAGTAFARHGSQGLRGDPANLWQPSLTKCRPLSSRTRCFRR